MSLNTDESQNYSNGLRKWDEKDFPQSNHVPDLNQTYVAPLQSLILDSCDIKTDIVGISMMIINNGVLLFHAFLSNIISWDVSNNTVTINTVDQTPTTFNFVSSDDATTASIRIEEIMNGADVQLCGIDDSAFYAIRRELDFSDGIFILTEDGGYLIEE